jgi:hypothetical protein
MVFGNFTMWQILKQKLTTVLGPLLHQESGPMLNPNQAFLLVQKFEISPKERAFTLGVQG